MIGIPCEPFFGLSARRGVSSAGRAPALQAGGRRFDPGTLHPFTRADFSGLTRKSAIFRFRPSASAHNRCYPFQTLLPGSSQGGLQGPARVLKTYALAKRSRRE
jgi:hypothetical protein